MIAGIGLALVTFVALAGVLVMHFVERAGTHNPSSEPSSLPSAQAAGEAVEGGPTPAAPTTLVPQKVELPEQTSPPIAPLDTAPAPDSSLHRKRKPKADAVE